jgi:hypothetical protein
LRRYQPLLGHLRQRNFKRFYDRFADRL